MTRLPLVIINGWGGTAALWQPFCTYLQAQADLPFSDIRCLDLPGFGANAGIVCDDPLAWLAAALPPKCYALGWSLGGQLACALRAREPERFAGLYLIASNPQFVATESWPGMAQPVFQNFQQRFSAQPEKTWQRFLALCSAGEALDVHELAAIWPAPSDQAQAACSLGWLASIRTQHITSAVLLAENDALVPAALAAVLPQASLVAGGHLLPYSQPQIVADWLLAHIEMTSACAESRSERAAC